MRQTITIKVLVTGGNEYPEYIGLDGKHYIGQDITKRYKLKYNTIGKNINWLKYRLIPFSVYKKDIEVSK